MERLKISRKWVMDKLHENGLKKISQVFYMGADKSGNAVVVKKGRDSNE